MDRRISHASRECPHRPTVLYTVLPESAQDQISAVPQEEAAKKNAQKASHTTKTKAQRQTSVATTAASTF